MGRTITGSLSKQGIQGIIDKLTEYADTLDTQKETFINLLLDRGIYVAYEALASGTHQMPKYITFYKDYEAGEDGVVGILVGIGETFLTDWITGDGKARTDEVWPLHMMEFGSAGYALPDGTAFGGHGGKGTFSRMGHENDTAWYVTVVRLGEKKRILGTAIYPTRPMYHAALAMREEIVECARKAYGMG